MGELPATTQKALALVPEVSAAVGQAKEDTPLSAAQLQQADACIDSKLINAANATDADKLTGCLIKTFLRFRHEAGAIDTALTHFIQADYTLHNGRWATKKGRETNSSNQHLGFDGAHTDGWAFGRAITHQLSAASSPYHDIAPYAGKQFARIMFAEETQGWHHRSKLPQPMATLRDMLAKAHITPFREVRVFEFAGHSDDWQDSLTQILGSYRNTNGAGKHGDIDVVTLKNAASHLPSRADRVTHIIARNVFNLAALARCPDPYDNADNLLCAFSNVLPDKGRLCISTSIGDQIDLRDLHSLLEKTGFTIVNTADDQCINKDDCNAPSYVLERDFRVRGPELITPDELHAWKHRSAGTRLTGGALTALSTTTPDFRPIQ